MLPATFSPPHMLVFQLQNGHLENIGPGQFKLGLERIHQVTNTIRIAIQGGEYDTYREYTFSQRLNLVMGKIWRRLTDCLESVPMSCLSLSFNYRK